MSRAADVSLRLSDVNGTPLLQAQLPWTEYFAISVKKNHDGGHSRPRTHGINIVKYVEFSLRILLVDDEPDITASLKIGLERRGFQVDAFNDPRKALAEFKSNVYDMIFLDIRMPQMNGFELYRQLRAKDVKVPIAFLTAFDVYQSEFQKMFPDMKVDKLLRKPIGITELVAYVNSQKSPAKKVAPQTASRPAT